MNTAPQVVSPTGIAVEAAAEIAFTIARKRCTSAVKGEKVLSTSEMGALIREQL